MISLLDPSPKSSNFISPLFQSTPFRDTKDHQSKNGNHSNIDEKDGAFMCFECAEVFDSKTELNKHTKTHILPVNHGSPKSMIRNISPYDKELSMDNSLWSLSSSFTDQLSRPSNIDNLNRSSPDSRMWTDSPNITTENPDANSMVAKKQFTITVTSSAADGADLNYICPVCGKSFMNRDTLSKHLEVHAGYVCSVCGRSYTTRSNLQTHMKKHNEDKPYICTQCDKSFTSLCDLKVHLRTHTGEKPFACPTCGVSFAKNIHLKRHLSIHTGIKPHECNICNKRFSRSDHLKRHFQSIHTQNRPHICSLCGKDFVRKYELNKHMKQQHWGFTVGDGSSDPSLNIPTPDKSGSTSKSEEEITENNISLIDIPTPDNFGSTSMFKKEIIENNNTS